MVEDHAATLEALCAELRRFPDRIAIVDTFADAESALNAPLENVDVVLVDLQLPGIGGTELIVELASRPAMPTCVALTGFSDERTVLETVEAGAFGYLLKTEPPERIVSCIEDAARGANPISSRVAGYLFSKARSLKPPVMLSKRERELALHLGDGLSYAECAAEMGLSYGTVQTYVKKLYRKLDVNTKREVQAWIARYAPNP